MAADGYLGILQIRDLIWSHRVTETSNGKNIQRKDRGSKDEVGTGVEKGSTKKTNGRWRYSSLAEKSRKMAAVYTYSINELLPLMSKQNTGSTNM